MMGLSPLVVLSEGPSFTPIPLRNGQGHGRHQHVIVNLLLGNSDFSVLCWPLRLTLTLTPFTCDGGVPSGVAVLFSK